MKNSPKLEMSVKANYAMGLWTAFVTQDGHEMCVIIDSERDAVIAEAQRIMETYQLKAA